MSQKINRFITCVISLFIVMLCSNPASAAKVEYSSFFEQNTGIAGYGETWLYETLDTQTPGAKWVAAKSKGMKVFWPTLMYNIIIYEGSHPEAPAQIYANGIIHARLDNIAVTFIAPSDGKLTILETRVQHWYPEASEDAGDGNLISILKNTTKIWPAGNPQRVDKNLKPDAGVFFVPEIPNVQVKKGDKIRFVVEQGENEWCDDLRWEPLIAFDDLKVASSQTSSSSAVSSAASSAAVSSGTSTAQSSAVASLPDESDVISSEVNTSSEVESIGESETSEASNSDESEVESQANSLVSSETEETPSNNGLLIGIIIAAVVVLGGGATLLYFMKIRK